MVSPAALEAAKYLERTYGTPYETGYPLVDELVYDMDYHGKKGTYCTAAGDRICNPGRDTKKAKDAQVTVASWFMIKARALQ